MVWACGENGVDGGCKWRAGTRWTEVRVDGWREYGLGQQRDDGRGCAKDRKEWSALRAYIVD